MLVIVDANPIISLLITAGKPIDLLFVEELDLVAPKLLFEEIENNKETIIQKSGLRVQEIDQFITILKRRIRVIPEEEFISQREEAVAICPDEKDVPYFALALYLRCPVWSNEKKLKTQYRVVVYATPELMELFGVNR